MDLSNCNIDYIKTCNNDTIGMISAYLIFNGFPLFLAFLLIFMNTQIMQIWLLAYLTMEWKAYVFALIMYKF